MAPRSARRPPPTRKRRSLFSRLRRRVFAGAPGPTKGGEQPPPSEGGDFGGVREPRRPKRGPSGAAAVRELPREQFLEVTSTPS